MGYNKLISSSIIATLLISYFVIPIAFSIVQDSYLAHNCSLSSGSYDAGSAYEQSLVDLVDDLCGKAPANKGFWFATWAEDTADPAHGLALCRGDVSPEDCNKCLINATIVSNAYCPRSRGAIIWRDYCMLKYSDVGFRGQIDTDHSFISAFWESVGDHKTFKEKDEELFSDLSGLAIAAPIQFAAKDIQVQAEDGNYTLYGMVQCTRDLSADHCYTCLTDAVSKLSDNMDKVGGRVVYGSCDVRYETYNFLN